MPTSIAPRLPEPASAAREAEASDSSLPGPVLDESPSPTAFADDVLLWALASSTCGGIDEGLDLAATPGS
ncbi:MAG: hypothetical protein KA750_00850 [Thermoflexales bacterium]|nr:hypothetical protein [Thermoflexales bacterium]